MTIRVTTRLHRSTEGTSVRRWPAAMGLAMAVIAAACSDDPGPRTDGGTTTSAPADTPLHELVITDRGIRGEVALSGLDQPSAVAFLDDGMLVAEKASGQVHVVSDYEVVGVAIDLAVNSFDERGLLGIAVHPEFPSQPYVYLHWTWRGDGDGADRLLGDDSEDHGDVPGLGNRVDRFRWGADDTLAYDRNIVAFPSATLDADTSGRVRGNHDAGPVAFDKAGKLYTMIGDQNLRGQLQNVGDGAVADDLHLSGVVLRLNDDGTVPEDNPFFDVGAEIGGDVGRNIQKIYAYGVRNSFGMAFEPRTDALWMTENGDDSYDEINVLTAGANSGWLQLQGPPTRFDDYRALEVDSEDGLDVPSFPPDNLRASATDAADALFTLPGSSYSPPVLSYRHPPAVTAIGFVPGAGLGGNEGGSVWIGTVLTDALIRYPLGADGRTLELRGALADGVDDNTTKGDLGESRDYVVGTGFGVITDIELSPDGHLYVVSLDQGKIFRLAESGS